MGPFPRVRDQFPLFFYFFCAKERDHRAWAALRDFSPNIALGYASFFLPQNYWERAIETELHKRAAAQKCTLLPTKPSLAAIPPVDPPSLVRLIIISVSGQCCAATCLAPFRDLLAASQRDCLLRAPCPRTAPTRCFTLQKSIPFGKISWYKCCKKQQVDSISVFSSSLLSSKGQVISTPQVQHPGR